MSEKNTPERTERIKRIDDAVECEGQSGMRQDQRRQDAELHSGLAAELQPGQWNSHHHRSRRRDRGADEGDQSADADGGYPFRAGQEFRSEEHTSELQ